MASGISTSKEQAGKGAPFVSFSTVFNNYFLPEVLPDLMDTSIEEQETYSVKKDDVLITRTSETIDELAMSCVATRDYPRATYSGFTKRLRPIKDGVVYSKYIAFYLRGYLFRKAVTNNAFMTLRASFNEDIFSFMKLYLPSYEQQKKIGDMLYTIEQKIQINKKINDNLYQQVCDLYDYWFTQYDYPNSENKTYKTSGGNLFYNESIGKSIPVTWKTTTIADITECLDSERIPLSANERLSMQGVFPYYGATEIMDFVNQYIFDGDYVLLAEDGSVMDKNGHPVLQRIHGKCWVNNHAHVLKPVSGYSCLLLQMLLKDIPVVKIKTGSIQYKVNQENMNSYVLPEIPDTLRKSFISITEPIDKKMLALRSEIDSLSKLRDWLLPMLMNGQASISD